MTHVWWQLDDRAPTLWARAYVLGMRLARDKSAFEGAERTRRTALARQRSGDAPPTRWTRLRCVVAEERVGSWIAWRVRPRSGPVVARVVYLHGGGYLHPLTTDYWRLVRRLVAAGAEVVAPAYPLAPAHTVDEALPWLEQVEVATRPSEGAPTVLMGDSAGGSLALVLAQRGVDAARVALLCPWLDATLGDAGVAELEPTDPMLAESGLRAAGRWWAGARAPGDALVSPVEGVLCVLPPIEVWIGDHDILRPAVDRLVRGVADAGGTVRVHEVTAMFHVWMTRLLPEGRRTRSELAALVRAVGTERRTHERSRGG